LIIYKYLRVSEFQTIYDYTYIWAVIFVMVCRRFCQATATANRFNYLMP